MKKLLSLLTSAAMVSIIFMNAAPASAVCAMQYPLIGTISSVQTDQYGNTRIILAHPTAFNSALFPSTSTNIDQYNSLATTFKQNGYSLPASYQYQDSYTPQGYSSWNDYFQQNYNTIYVNTTAMNSVSYQIGDIVVQGPPGGGACLQDGFTGFFGQNGIIQEAVATASGARSYTFGIETLSLTDTTPQYSCTTDNNSFPSGNTVCKVPVLYSLNSNATTLREGETKQLNGAHFKNVSLIVSTNTTINCQSNIDESTGGAVPMCWVEDFSPRALLHVLTFGTASSPTPVPAPPPPQPLPPSPIPQNCPQIVRRLARGSEGNDVLALQRYFISIGVLGQTSATGYFGPLTEGAVQKWQSSRELVSSGSPATTGWGAVGPRTRAMLSQCK